METSHLTETPWTSYTDELTRSHSVASSLAAEVSKDTFKLSGKASLCKCSARSYEKHNQYLNRLETSFVKQLHQSMDLLAWYSEQDKNARNPFSCLSSFCYLYYLAFSACHITSLKTVLVYLSRIELQFFFFFSYFPYQFTFMRGCCKQTFNLEKITEVGSHDVLRSPWMKHFKCAIRPCSTGWVDLSKCCRIHQEENLFREQRVSSHRIGGHSENLAVNCTYYGDSVGIVAEGSGQNFMDNICEDDSRSQTKKLKVAVADD